jgi:hypothetical protein
MTSAHGSAWERLGALLIQRRIEISPRYRVRTLFASDVGLNWRLLYDIERHKRDSFTDETLAAIEVAYQWRKGSVASVLAGGDPVPADAGHPAADDARSPLTAEEQRIAEAYIEGLRAAVRKNGAEPARSSG